MPPSEQKTAESLEVFILTNTKKKDEYFILFGKDELMNFFEKKSWQNQAVNFLIMTIS